LIDVVIFYLVFWWFLIEKFATSEIGGGSYCYLFIDMFRIM